MSQEKAISPEWLESKGFVLVTTALREDWIDFPAVFDVEYNAKHLCYLEKGVHRSQFCIVLTPCEYTGGERYFRFEIWVQYNIGCGWSSIPNQFTEMTEYHFSLLYEAIRREKL
jgi:hypothetical protein